MKVIDEKGRVFGKINIFDLIVLLAIVILIGGIGYKMVNDRKESQGTITGKTYIARVKCAAMPDTFAEALSKDDRIFYDNVGFTNAKIIKTEELPAVITVQNADGQLVEAVDPSLMDVYVELEIYDNPNDADIKIGRYAVAVGGKLSIKTIYAHGADGIVLDIKEK